jgi:MoaA/NifB/PqqE/SkfB family radical SAM enzyme
MLYRQKFDTFIRIYRVGTENPFGYIVSRRDIGERITDDSGAVFLAVLSRKAKNLETLTDEIIRSFINVDRVVLQQDIIEFYKVLEDDGFIVSGQTPEELDRKDTRFSYSAIVQKTMQKDWTPLFGRAKMNTQEYLKQYFKDKPQLMSLHIELTSCCNERCVHCYIPHENKLHDIEPELFYSVLEQCSELGVLNLTISGGEPLLHKHFLNFLCKVKEYDFSINILSNLTLLNDDIIAEMKTCHLSSVQTSLYSMNPEVHDAITKMPGSFFKTRDAVLRLIENDIPIRIACPTMKQNKDDYVDVSNWANEHKVRATTDYIMMARYDNTTGNLENRLSLDEVKKIINGIINNDTKYQEEILADNFVQAEMSDTSNENVCGACVSSLCMVANGNCYPCAGWQNYVCGNVKEMPLRKIWEHSEKVQYLRSLRKKDFSKCLVCPDKLFCSMCMVRNANENCDLSAVGTIGDPLKINGHFCKVATLTQKIILEWKGKMAMKMPKKENNGNDIQTYSSDNNG